jgi:hypothetical protein
VYRRWGAVDDYKMEYYLRFLNTLTNSSLQNLPEFQRYANEAALDKITDLEDMAMKV